MIKKCPVILNNKCVTVVKYGNKEIQLPAINKETKEVSVEFIDGKYTIVDENKVQFVKNDEHVTENKKFPKKAQERKYSGKEAEK